MATVHICDRCGNEIGGMVAQATAKANAGQVVPLSKWDLCDLCYEALGDFLRGAMLDDASVRYVRDKSKATA